MVAWNFIFFLILFEGKRRRGEFKIVLIVLAKLKPKGSISSCISCLLCPRSRWVGPCVPGVIEGSKDAALVWIKGEPRGISYWAVSHLESCQASTMELLRERIQWPQQVDIFPKKGPITDVWLDSKCTPDCRCCKCEVRVNWKCMEFATAVWLIEKKLWGSIRL